MKNKCFISVGEPWNFNSPDGQNIINGSIIKKISPTCIVFKANYELIFNEIIGSIFVLYPRYIKSDFDDFNKKVNTVTINGSILSEEYYEKMDEKELKMKSKFVIIGGLIIT